MLSKQRAFTLVEILIVVVILGILAAIVIPQFANASSQSKNTGVQSTLQTIRSQVQLFDSQHGDVPPQTTGMPNFELMLLKSDATETSVAAPAGTSYGPYLQALPLNPLMNNKSGSSTSATDTNSGWYYSATLNGYTVYARDATGASITTY